METKLKRLKLTCNDGICGMEIDVPGNECVGGGVWMIN